MAVNKYKNRIANGMEYKSFSKKGLGPQALCRFVASLSLFGRYYNGRCSNSLSLVFPPNCTSEHTTHFSAHLHPYTVAVPKANTQWYSSSFFPQTALLWKSLPVSSFPSSYSLSQFKPNISGHLFTLRFPYLLIPLF